jgi:hypothetical protein
LHRHEPPRPLALDSLDPLDGALGVEAAAGRAVARTSQGQNAT